MDRQTFLLAQRGMKQSGTGCQVRDAESWSDSFEQQEVLKEAGTYLRLFQQETAGASYSHQRLHQIQAELRATGLYRQTTEELAYGAKVAWRNNTRCIGRLHWSSLIVRDMRHLKTADEIFAALVEHICLATHGGKIRSLITIFAPQSPGQMGIRIWNPQLIRYAGYVQSNGSIVGDPAQAELTEVLLELGWQGKRGTPFDVLPLVIQLPDQPPRLFELPPECILEVPISHPRYEWFADLGLKWHALPVISNMRLEIGGISYTAAPFNGWYMGTEVGARNLADKDRYNMLPQIAKKMKLNTRSERTLWRDQALVELNIAVMHSFACQNVSIVDHHTASRQFMQHEKRERHSGRMLAADWGWIVPPLSAAQTPMFHKAYENIIQTPNFFLQSSPWLEHLQTRYAQETEEHRVSLTLCPACKIRTLPPCHNLL